MSVTHEVFREVERLGEVLLGLRDLASSMTPGHNLQAVGVAMTAELCDVFENRAKGVRRILNLVRAAFEGLPVWVWTVDRRFEELSHAYNHPLAAAATNWLASAVLVSRHWRGPGLALLVDMGSTTTDIVPLIPGAVLAAGYTDQERLARGELLYAGFLRTPVQDIVPRVFINGESCRTTAEYFTVTADVYRLLGWIGEEQYNIQAPDKRSSGLADCARRLARLVALDLEALEWEEVYLLAHQVKEKHLSLVLEAIWQVLSRRELGRLLFRRGEAGAESELPWPLSDSVTMVLAGVGLPLLEEAARRLGVKAWRWWDLVSVSTGKEERQAGEPVALTAFALARLLADHLETGRDGWLRL